MLRSCPRGAWIALLAIGMLASVTRLNEDPLWQILGRYISTHPMVASKREFSPPSVHDYSKSIALPLDVDRLPSISSTQQIPESLLVKVHDVSQSTSRQAQIGRVSSISSTQLDSKVPVLIEAASVDRRECIGSRWCHMLRIIVWGMRHKRDITLASCSTTNLGSGELTELPDDMGPIRRLFSFQAVCSFNMSGRVEHVHEFGSMVLEITIGRHHKRVRGPLVKERQREYNAKTHECNYPGGCKRIGCCTGVLFGKPYFPIAQWLNYQRKLGVSGVHVYTYGGTFGLDQQARDAISNVSSLNVELVEWPAPAFKIVNVLSEGHHDMYLAQANALSHCVLSNAGSYDWIIVSDMDEFLQIGPGYYYSSVEQLLNTAGTGADGIRIPRKYFQGSPPDNLTLCPHAKRRGRRNLRGKSIVSTYQFLKMNAHEVTFTLNSVEPVILDPKSDKALFAHVNRIGGCQEKA